PEILALRAPDDLVEGGEREEEQRPAEGQLPPALVGQPEHAVEHHREQRLAEGEAAEQHGPEQRVHDGRLHHDEGLVLERQGQAPEHQHHEAGDERHDRQAPHQGVVHGERRDGRRDEHAGGDEQLALRRHAEALGIGVREEEQD
ncbi:hypothetical protein QU39_00190, partial [Staphylococcus aureus]